MKVKLILTRSEYGVLMVAMQQIFQVEAEKKPTRRVDIQALLTIALMQSLYIRLASAGLLAKEKYRFSVPVPEALAFQLYWTGKRAEGIFDSMLINRIIAEIDKIAINYSTINCLT